MQLWCASAEDTVIGKLRWAKEAGSARQSEDAAGIVTLRGSDLDIGYIRGWVGELELSAQWDEVLMQSRVRGASEDP